MHMAHRAPNRSRRSALAAFAAAANVLAVGPLMGADHLDTHLVADPRADIGDLFAWMSHDGRRLNLVMTIVGRSFSDELQYVFHVDSGKRFGQTTATTNIVCRIPKTNEADCRAGDVDASKKKLRVFAGIRDDPFFNNVRGTRDAYQFAAAALKGGTPVDAADAPADAATSRTILDKWRHTDGGPAQDFLKGWTPASLVVSVDLGVINKGGTTLAVWATTVKDGKHIDRMGRPLTGNAMLGPLATAEVSTRSRKTSTAQHRHRRLNSSRK